MKYCLVLLLLFQVQDSYAYRTIISQDKRQLPDLDSDSAACFAAYLSLSDDENKCFHNGDNNDDGSSDDPLNPDSLDDVYNSEFCMDVAKKLLEACKV